MNNIALDIDTFESLLKQTLRSVLQETMQEAWDERFTPSERKQLQSIKQKMNSRSPLNDEEIRLASHAGLILRSQAFIWTKEFLSSLKRAEIQYKKGAVKRAASVEELSAMLHLED